MGIAMSVDVLQLRAGSWRCEDAEGCTALLPLYLAPSVCLCVCLFVFQLNLSNKNIIPLYAIFLPCMHSITHSLG